MVQPSGHNFVIQIPSRLAHRYTHEGYEPLSSSIFKLSAINSDAVIDIGGHVGFYSLLAASANSSSRIITVEASTDNANVIKQNASLNEFQNIEIINAAFRDRAGVAEICVTEASDNCGIAGHPRSPTIALTRVNAITGSDLCLEAGSSVLIKVDVEGNELEALKGLEPIIKASYRTRLLLEFNPKCIKHANSDARDIISSLIDYDFRIFAINDSNFTWTEYSHKEQSIDDIANQLTRCAGEDYLNIWCLPATSAKTICVQLHSPHTSGAERSHIEFVEDMILEGCMINTLVPSPGGPIVPLLQNAGSSVTLVTDCQWWAHGELNTINTQSSSDMHKICSPEIVEKIRKANPDIVLTQTSVIPQSAVAASILGKPHIWWLREFCDLDHGLHLPLSPREMGNVFKSLSTYIFVNSEAVANHFFDKASESVIIKSPLPRNSKAMFKDNSSQENRVVGVVASFQAGKGHIDAIRAIALLSSRGFSIQLRLYGHGNPDQVTAIKNAIRDLGAQKYISIAGHIDNRDKIYEQLNAVIVPSRNEAFGRVSIEATNAGIPVVFASSGGLGEAMIAGVTGLTYEPGDTKALADAIKDVLYNRDLGKDLVERAKKHICDLKNVDRFSSAHTKEIIDSACASHSLSAASAVVSMLAKQFSKEQHIIHRKIKNTLNIIGGQDAAE